MKRPKPQLLLFLLILCLLAVLAACGSEPEPPIITEQSVPVTTEAPRPMPEPGPDRLELDGKELGPIYLLEGEAYVELQAIRDSLELDATELADGKLELIFSDSTLTLRDGSNQFERADGALRPLSTGAPVLKGNGTWYLPELALELFWGRKSVRDPENAVLRCYTLEQGPALLYNGSEAGESFLLGGCPMLSAALLAELTEAEAEKSASAEGTPALTLRVWDHVLRFRSGSLGAELDGEALELPVPAYQDVDSWYLPESVMEALGCVALTDSDAGSIALWRPSEGPALWFDGTGLGMTQLCGETPCAGVSLLAEAAGGSLEQTEDALILSLEGHSLSLRPGSAEAAVDGNALSLPTPVLPLGEDWLVPVEPLAEAIGIPRLEGEELIFSRMEPRDTVLFVDGREGLAYARGEEPLFLRLNDVLLLESNEPVWGENSLEFTAFGKTLSLVGGSDSVLIDGAPLALSAPARVDGTKWYAPAAELLTALGLTELRDPELDQIYYTQIVRHDELAAGYRVPVLMYHAVSDSIWGIPELFVSPSSLEKQLQALTEGGYTAITFEDLDHIDEIEKPVMLTFDDGYDDNYTELFPLLKQYNVKATVFVIVNDLGKNHKLTEDQVREMSESGLVSIQSHTMSHGYLDGMYEKQLRYENYDSMIALARITGKQPFVLCYPTGKSSGYSRNITAEYYEYGLCMGGPCWVTGDAPYRIYRYYIPRKTTVETFLQYLEG